MPALVYTLQNNLIFLALSNLSAASCQVLYQTKTITTALFSVVLLGKRFGWRQWLSFFLLAFGVVLVQSQDAKSEQAPEGNRPLVGIGAALTAAALSGFAGCYLELMFNKGATSLWMRNVQLALFTIPLQLVAVAQSDLAAVRRHGLLQGFTTLTWLVVFTQFAGGLVVAVVIKYCGNILKTMATVVAIIVTCFLSMALFDARPTALFCLSVAVVSVSIWLYSQKPSAPSRSPRRGVASTSPRRLSLPEQLYSYNLSALCYASGSKDAAVAGGLKLDARRLCSALHTSVSASQSTQPYSTPSLSSAWSAAQLNDTNSGVGSAEPLPPPPSAAAAEPASAAPAGSSA